MGLLRKIVGPSKEEEAWRNFASEIGGEFIKGRHRSVLLFGWKENDEVAVKVDHWTVRFDTHSSGGGASSGSTTYTRVRASCSPKEWFRFEVLRRKRDVLDELSQSLSSRIGNLSGMQDIEVGYPEFDRDFIVKSDDESKVRALFANPTIRELIQAQRSIQLQTRTRRAPLANRTILQLIRALPIINLQAEEELHFEEPNVITNVNRLKSLNRLFAETLSQLHEIGAID